MQLLGQFFSTVTKRTPNPLSAEEAKQEISRIVVLPAVGIDTALVRRGIFTQKRYGIAYWDALIVATTERAGYTHIFSKDLAPGQCTTESLSRIPYERWVVRRDA